MAKIIPSKGSMKKVGKEAIKAGVVGGLVLGLTNTISGGSPIMSMIGGILAGSMVGGTAGTVVAVNSIMPIVAGMMGGLGAGAGAPGVL
jgi:hypothetical protein